MFGVLSQLYYPNFLKNISSFSSIKYLYSIRFGGRYIFYIYIITIFILPRYVVLRNDALHGCYISVSCYYESGMETELGHVNYLRKKRLFVHTWQLLKFLQQMPQWRQSPSSGKLLCFLHLCGSLVAVPVGALWSGITQEAASLGNF